MLKIRLKRIGKKGQAFFRVVVMESTRNRGSKAIDDLGAYNPHIKDAVSIDKEKALKWIGSGAQPTETVLQYFVKLGISKPSKKGSTESKGRTKKKESKQS